MSPPNVRLDLPLEIMTLEKFKQGDVLFRAGDPADKMYYISKGCIDLQEIGKRVMEGAIIGEMGILSPFQERTATAVCPGDLEVYTIGKEDIIRLFARDSALAFQIVHICIQRFIENLRAETQAKERIQSELRIAHDIQVSMLPRTFPPFPDRPEIDIFAVMEPAKEVGGDFYDFFLVDKTTLCLLVGDVSGKGVPAALFMAICKTLLKTEAMRGLSPAEILGRVNQLLIPDNETLMFVTVALVLVDLETGAIRFASGGHPPPLLSAASGSVEIVPAPQGTVLGAVEDASFENGAARLQPGDVLVLYSDGVTEAMNAGQELFAEDRLKGIVARTRGNGPADVIRTVRDGIKAFVQETPQSDDITLVALRFNGGAGPTARN